MRRSTRITPAAAAIPIIWTLVGRFIINGLTGSAFLANGITLVALTLFTAAATLYANRAISKALHAAASGYSDAQNARLVILKHFLASFGGTTIVCATFLAFQLYRG